MIDFRYHLVTVIAIFLALAIGIVVGTTALNGAVVTNLQHNVSRLQHDANTLADERQSAAASLAVGSAFAAAAEPALVAGRLRGLRVALLGLPGTSRGQRNALAGLLRGAGAKVVAELALTETVLSGTEQNLLAVVCHDLAAPGVALPAGGPTPAVADLAALLAAALTATSQAEQVSVSGLTGYHFLVDDLTVAEPAQAVLVVAPGGAAPTPPRHQPAPSEVNLATAVLSALAGSAQAIELTGPESSLQPGGVLAGVRAADPGQARTVVVDGSDQAAGQVAAVLALVAARRGGSGDYGIAPGDTALPSGVLPSLLPSAAPSSPVP